MFGHLILSLAFLCVVAAAVNAAATKTPDEPTTQAVGDAHMDDLGNMVDAVRRNRYELHRANSASPTSKPADAELANDVRQVRTLDLTPKPLQPAQKAATTAASGPVASTNPAQSPMNIDAKTLEKLRQLPDGQITKALEMADSLFVNERYDTAYAFYEFALKAQPAADAKAWILFQMGNCRRTADPSAARDLYKRLLSESPDSPWANAAAAQDRLIEWDQLNNPRALVAKPQPETNPGK